MGAISCFFPVALNVAGGMREIDKVLIRVGRSFRANTWQMVTKIYLPAMRHPVINGVRLGLGVAPDRHAAGGDEAVEPRHRLSGDPGLQHLQHAADVFAADHPVRDRDRRQRADRPPRRARQTSGAPDRVDNHGRGVPWLLQLHPRRRPSRSLPICRRIAIPITPASGRSRNPIATSTPINPGTGESLGKVVDGSVADAEAAIAAAKAAFREWRRVPPLERAKMLRAIADVLRKNGDELAMIDAADCGNPYAEMVRDANAGAAQLDFYAGLVTEMKGASIPMGPDAVNFSVREPFGVVGRIIPFNHPFMFAAGKSAAPLAAGNTIVVKPPEQAPLSSLRLAELIDGILPPGVWNLVPGGKEVGQVLASHPDVAKVALIGSVPTGRAVMKAASDTLKPVTARARRQERADRLPRCRSRRGLGRRGRRHELHLVRAVLRLDQPRLRAREDLRRGARAREELGQALQARHSDRSRDHHGLDREQGAVRPRAELHRGRQAGRRPARQRRQAAERSASRQGLLRRADGVRRRDHGHAHRQGGNLRPRALGAEMERRGRRCWRRSTRSNTG